MLINSNKIVLYMSSNSTSASQQTTIDNEKLQQFMGKILSDFGGAASSVLVYIGDKLGFQRITVI
jgi:hypothetical protein